MKKMIFTICSNNYLPYAFSLCNSINSFSAEYDFIIGLSDRKLPGVDYRRLNILSCTSLKHFPIKNAIIKFNLIEFNTCIKPFLFYHFLKNLDYDIVYYLDPDILFFNDPFLLDIEFADYNFIVTPHSLSPVGDDKQPSDFQMIQTGLYNLGFIGIKKSFDSLKFILWWADKVINFGYANISKSMFYDQLWVNLLPIYHDNVLISRHLGMNASSWNLHERMLSKSQDGSYYVNHSFPLIFYHFAEYKVENPQILASFCNRYDFVGRPDVKDIYETFHNNLIDNGYYEYINIPNGLIIK